MRCRCCDKKLSEFEATRKSINTGEYLDMCNRCYSTISKEVLTYERGDLKVDNDSEEAYDSYNLLDDVDIVVDNHDKNW